MPANSKLHFTTPGLTEADASRVVELLQDRLHACNDLHLTLKHVHWNVVGPHFIAVHEMIDPQVEAVRGSPTTSPSGSPPWAAPRRAPRVPWSPPGAGTSTPSGGPAPRSTSGRSTSSTGG